MQPPPRGCVLKLHRSVRFCRLAHAAASARLCVETMDDFNRLELELQPPPRGCVLKLPNGGRLGLQRGQPPPRGCVLKLVYQVPLIVR